MHGLSDSPEPNRRASASLMLRQLAGRLSGETTTIGEVFDSLGRAGLGLTLLVLTLPAMIPLPGPFGLVFGTAIAFVAVQVLSGVTRVWLPSWVRARRLPTGLVGAMVVRVEPWLRRAEMVLRPRRMKMLTNRAARVALALPLLALAVALALPIPFGNILPVIGLTVFALGFLARDGVAILIALGLTVVALGWTAFLALAGTHITDRLAVWIGQL